MWYRLQIASKKVVEDEIEEGVDKKSAQFWITLAMLKLVHHTTPHLSHFLHTIIKNNLYSSIQEYPLITHSLQSGKRSALFSTSVSDRLWPAESYQADRPPSHKLRQPRHYQASTSFNSGPEQQTRPALSTCQPPCTVHTRLSIHMTFCNHI